MASEDAFIRQYEEFVRAIVLQTRRQIGVDAELDDLMGYAFEGLLQAHRRFDPARGVKFRAFAYYRVRGAVIDGIRAMSPMPRRAYERLRAATALDTEAEVSQDAQANADRPSGAEAARQLDAILGRAAAAYCVATMADADQERTPETVAVDRQRRDRIRAAIERLPKREAALVRGHYLEGRPFDTIAEELGLSKSWASRLHSRALGLLREALLGQES